MWDFFKTLYEIFGVPYPRVSIAIAALIGGFIFGMGWWFLGKHYERAQTRTGEAEIVARNAGEPFVRQSNNSNRVLRERPAAELGVESYSAIERHIGDRIGKLDFQPAKSYDGYVMNYVYSFTRNDVMRSNSHHGHQGAPAQVVEANEALLLAELGRRDDRSIHEIVTKALPSGYSVDWIYLRIIFDHRGVFRILQGIEGNVVGPDGESRPLRRVVAGGGST